MARPPAAPRSWTAARIPPPGARGGPSPPRDCPANARVQTPPRWRLRPLPEQTLRLHGRRRSGPSRRRPRRHPDRSNRCPRPCRYRPPRSRAAGPIHRRRRSNHRSRASRKKPSPPGMALLRRRHPAAAPSPDADGAYRAAGPARGTHAPAPHPGCHRPRPLHRAAGRRCRASWSTTRVGAALPRWAVPDRRRSAPSACAAPPCPGQR